jgi:hypothetical protein
MKIFKPFLEQSWKIFLNYRIDYNSISQTVEKVVKKIFFSAPKASKSGDRQVLVEHNQLH